MWDVSPRVAVPRESRLYVVFFLFLLFLREKYLKLESWERETLIILKLRRLTILINDLFRSINLTEL